MARYGEAFRNRAVARLLPPDAWCREHGVYPAELDQWRMNATTALAEPEEARASPRRRGRTRSASRNSNASYCAKTGPWPRQPRGPKVGLRDHRHRVAHSATMESCGCPHQRRCPAAGGASDTQSCPERGRACATACRRQRTALCRCTTSAHRAHAGRRRHLPVQRIHLQSRAEGCRLGGARQRPRRPCRTPGAPHRAGRGDCRQVPARVPCQGFRRP